MLFAKGQKGKRSKTQVELSVTEGMFGSASVTVHVWEADAPGDRKDRQITHSFYIADREYLEAMRDVINTALSRM